ncbi:MAG: M24 family metallopeptidase [Hyphomicrobiales bacterium]
MAFSERLNTPISTAELERRWKLVREAMAREKIDVLLMQNNNDHMGGYVRWFTDIPATNGYPNTVVFPRDDEMTVVCQGPFGGNETPSAADGIWRGVKQVLTTPSYASAHYTATYDPELACKGLEPFADATIGFVGDYQMSYALSSYVRRKFSKARHVDATEMVDRIKVFKSPEEMELIKRAAAMQDGAMRAAFAAIKPGMRDTEVAAVAQAYSQCHGSENGIYLCASMPLGQPSRFGNRHMQNRTIQKGDQFVLLVEDNGPGGMYTELGRSCVVGAKVPQAMKDELAFCIESRQVTLDLLKPGTPSKAVWDGFNAFMRKNGRPMESRLYCHGQGYDLVERPLVRNDEPMTIEKDMNIVVHPTYIHAGYLNWLCDNYLIGDNGPGERLHKFPEEITEVG